MLNATKFPAYIAPGPEKLTSFRTKRSMRMLWEDKSITYDELLAYKHSTRMELADAVVPELLAAAQKSDDPLVREAAAVLRAWDRSTETYSRGGVLFEIFADRALGGGDGLGDVFRVKYDYRRSLETPLGLADPARAVLHLRSAAEECKRLYGALDVPWGDVHRYKRGNLDIPANGASGRLGVFRTMQFARREAGKLYATHGETFVCAIEFARPQQRAQCLLGYGNASQPGSKHIEDQLPLMQQKKLHPVWREKAELEPNLELRETVVP